MLEVGCGTGNTLLWLKENHGCRWAAGMELFAAAAAEAETKVDKLFTGNIERDFPDIEPSSLDLVLCLDVLEHLVDPWSITTRLRELLRPGGALIISVPNIRNRGVLFPLLFKGKWEYADAGILDRTHLRFFVRSSAIAMLEQAGLHVDMVRATGLERKTEKSRRLIAMLPESIRSFLVLQYLIRGVRE